MQKQMTQQVLEEIQKRLELRTFSISIGGVEMELIKKEDIVSVLSDYYDAGYEKEHTRTA